MRSMMLIAVLAIASPAVAQEWERENTCGLTSAELAAQADPITLLGVNLGMRPQEIVSKLEGDGFTCTSPRSFPNIFGCQMTGATADSITIYPGALAFHCEVSDAKHGLNGSTTALEISRGALPRAQLSFN